MIIFLPVQDKKKTWTICKKKKKQKANPPSLCNLFTFLGINHKSFLSNNLSSEGYAVDGKMIKNNFYLFKQVIYVFFIYLILMK